MTQLRAILARALHLLRLALLWLLAAFCYGLGVLAGRIVRLVIWGTAALIAGYTVGRAHGRADDGDPAQRYE